MNQCFVKSSRLLKRHEFMTLARRGAHFSGECILVQWRVNTMKRLRLGITVTKKYGKAHTRNRFKRHVREAFRLLSPVSLENDTNSIDLNIRPRMNKESISFEEVQKDLTSFLKSLSKQTAQESATLVP